MPKARKICEHSLRWVLAMRQNARIHHYSKDLLTVEHHPEVFGGMDPKRDFGHSGGSFHWTVAQAKKIDEIGLDKWLKSEAALGYGHAFDKSLGLFLKDTLKEKH